MDMGSLMPIVFLDVGRTGEGRKEERGSERSDPPPAATAAPPVECMLLLLLSVPGDGTGHVHWRESREGFSCPGWCSP